MKKLSKVVLALTAVCTLTAVGCSKKEGGSSAKGGSKEYQGVKAQKDPATGKIYDFGGLEVTIYDWWSNPDAPVVSKQQEDEKAFRQWMMDTYNFKVVQTNLAGWGEHPTEVANYCITGGDDARVFIVDGRSAISGLKANFWADLSKVPNVDWSNKKWNRAVLDVLKSGDSFYTFAYGKPEPRHCIFWNKRVLQENGYDPDVIYDLQKSGEWTWAKFEEMCANLTKDTDNDGVIDQYAMASFNSEFTWAALQANGGSIVDQDSNGKYYLNLESDNSMEALNWTKKMFVNYQMPQAEGAAWDYFKTAFTNGEVAFYVNHEYDAQPNGLLATMKDDWGMACFPLGPNGDGKLFTLNSDNMFVIPNCYSQDKVNKIMKIIDFWTTTTPGYEDEEAWKEGYYAGFRDTRAVDETMQYMMDNSVPWKAWLIPGLNYAPVSWDICGGRDPAETIEARKPELQATLDEMNK